MDREPRRRTKAWNEIHVTLDRALANCGLSPIEQSIMETGRELSYREARLRGLQDPIPFVINLTVFAARWGYDYRAVRRAWHRIKSSRLILDDEGGWSTINKDHRTWTGAHKLSATQVHAVESGELIPPEATDRRAIGVIKLPGVQVSGDVGVIRTPERNPILPFEKGQTPPSKGGDRPPEMGANAPLGGGQPALSQGASRPGSGGPTGPPPGGQSTPGPGPTGPPPGGQPALPQGASRPGSGGPTGPVFEPPPGPPIRKRDSEGLEGEEGVCEKTSQGTRDVTGDTHTRPSLSEEEVILDRKVREAAMRLRKAGGK